MSDAVLRAKMALVDIENSHCGGCVEDAVEVLIAVAPELIAEIERLRANQRHEQLEPWLGKAKGIDG